MLTLAVFVSLFGMINTLVLSVYERTRELGMLRADRDDAPAGAADDSSGEHHHGAHRRGDRAAARDLPRGARHVRSRSVRRALRVPWPAHRADDRRRDRRVSWRRSCPRAAPRSSIRSRRSSTNERGSQRDPVRPEGHPRPEAPDRADGARDRARRRDGERHLRAHRLDRQGVRRHLHGVSRRPTARSPASRRSTSRMGRAVSAPLLDESLLDEVRAVPGVGAADGGVAARRNSSRTTARRSSSAARPTSASRSRRDPCSTRSRSMRAPGPGPARWPSTRPPPTRRTSRRRRDRRAGRRAGRASRISGFFRFGSVDDDRRGHARRVRPAHGAEVLRQGRQARRDRASPPQPGVAPRRWSRTSRRFCRRPRRSSSPRAGDGGRRGHERVHHLPAGLPARFRGHRALRRRFVIANSLSITIAQRTREFATLRTLGGSRRQVRARS